MGWYYLILLLLRDCWALTLHVKVKVLSLNCCWGAWGWFVLILHNRLNGMESLVLYHFVLFYSRDIKPYFLRKKKEKLSSKDFVQWMLPASVAQLDAPSDWRPGGRGFNPRLGRQHSFAETDHEIFSMVILSLPLIQEGQLSVSGKRMCTLLVNP